MIESSTEAFAPAASEYSTVSIQSVHIEQKNLEGHLARLLRVNLIDADTGDNRIDVKQFGQRSRRLIQPGLIERK